WRHPQHQIEDDRRLSSAESSDDADEEYDTWRTDEDAEKVPPEVMQRRSKGLPTAEVASEEGARKQSLLDNLLNQGRPLNPVLLSFSAP
ncbi:MAG: hypothetical protein ACK559_20675, partial [bacterium]